MSVLLFPRYVRFIALKTVLSFACHALLSITGWGVAQASWALSATGTEQALKPVLVSASRFPDAFDATGATPVGAIVIDAEQIRQSGADNVNQAIRSIAGIAGRPNSYGTSDFTLDLRGFGASADQNVVILLDGVRLSENEMSTALLSSIPIETVQRIEIVRGGSSVLYGEGATGGTIQVITRRPARGDSDADSRTRGSVTADTGSYGRRGSRLSLAHAWAGWSLDLDLGHAESDNYRDNNRLRSQNIGSGLQWSGAGRRIGLRVDRSDQHYRTAGALSMAQYQSDPRSSNTPDDYGAARITRATLSVEQQLGAFEWAAELSRRDKDYYSHTVGSYGISDYTAHSRTTQFSPRLRYASEFAKSAGLRNELVAGVDISASARRAGSASGAADGGQHSQAIYARDEIRNDTLRLAFGMRREKFDQRSANPQAFIAGSDYVQSQTLNAWDVQASIAVLPQAVWFAKAGRSYRVANIDENGFTLQPGQMLLPQLSNDLALGAQFGGARHSLSATFFQHALHNEIMYDPSVANPVTGGNGANVNLSPTLRRGLELEARSQLNAALALSLNFQHVAARFRSGPNAGKEMVLVPRNAAGARLNWTAGRHAAWAGMQWAASQRYGSDFDNNCVSRMPAYVTLDARYALRLARWELAVSGSNLGNKNYFSQAYSCAGGIYPAAGRQMALTARYEFL